MAGAHGIEGRFPYLDVDLVQEYLWLNTTLKATRQGAPARSKCPNPKPSPNPSPSPNPNPSPNRRLQQLTRPPAAPEAHPLARGCSLGAGRRGPAAQLPKAGCGGAASHRSHPGFTAPGHPIQARTRPSCRSTPTWRAPATLRSGRSAASGTRAGRRGTSTSPGRRISRRSAPKRRAGSRSERRAPRELWARRARRQCARPQRAQGVYVARTR